MKKIFFALCALTLSLTSCDFIEDVKDDLEAIRIPSEATPAKPFTLNEFPEEPYAAYAARYTNPSGTPFATIEFFGNGTYAMTKSTTARAAKDEVISGTFTMPDASHYLLDDGTVFDISGFATNGSGAITVTPAGSDEVTVTVTPDAPMVSAATSALCRTWHLETSKYWFTVKGFNALYRGYSMQNGQITHEDNGFADKVSFLANGDPMTKDVWPEYVSISPFGTYFVQFASGKTALQSWKWSNETSGTIRLDNLDINIMEYLRIATFTVRFNNGHLHLFGDVNITDVRVLAANDFTVAAQ